MPLFTVSKTALQPVTQSKFTSEKALQELVEANLEVVFNCRLVATQFPTGAQHAGRIDTLALSEDHNPMIIEYKNVESSDLVNQSLFYLAWIHDHRGDFDLTNENKVWCAHGAQVRVSGVDSVETSIEQLEKEDGMRKGLVGLALCLIVAALPSAQAPYYPPAGQWAHKAPAEVGMNAAKLNEAVAFMQAHETTSPARDFSDQEIVNGKLLASIPTERAATNGLIIRHGYIVAEFGDTLRPDPTYSVAKSMLSTVTGIALERGLIPKLDDPVVNVIKDGGYDSPHNQLVIWRNHLQQESEWEGEMWGKNANFIGTEAFGRDERKPRAIKDPGTFYEYNDVRINRMALSLLRVFKRPLPDVMKEAVMDPIGASQTWKYLGYDNSDAVIDGKTMKSVTGGTRWGGGWWVNSRDQARYGYLFLRKGKWKDRQILSEKWVRMATTPGPVGPDYGYLWWLNTQGKAWPHAPKSSFAARGHGSNMIWVDPEHDLVVVWRWHAGGPDEFLGMVIQAIKTTTTPHE